MGAVQMDHDRLGPTRPIRVRINLETSLILSSGESLNVTVIDLSKAGVRLQVPEPIFVGETVELELGRSGFAKVVIAWSEESEAGGSFVDLE